MRTIGLIGGMSWQSSKLYYDRINQLVVDRLGGLHSAQLIVYSLDFAPIAAMQAEGRWEEAGRVLAAALRRDARAKPLLLGTRHTMEDAFLRDHLADKGLDVIVPDKPDRDALHAIIYDELVKGVVTDAARTRVRAMIAAAGAHEADSVIFGCTEIGMLFPPTDAGLPGYDTLDIHAQALVDFALRD